MSSRLSYTACASGGIGGRNDSKGEATKGVKYMSMLLLLVVSLSIAV